MFAALCKSMSFDIQFFPLQFKEDLVHELYILQRMADNKNINFRMPEQ